MVLPNITKNKICIYVVVIFIYNPNNLIIKVITTQIYINMYLYNLSVCSYHSDKIKAAGK